MGEGLARLQKSIQSQIDGGVTHKRHASIAGGLVQFR